MVLVGVGATVVVGVTVTVGTVVVGVGATVVVEVVGVGVGVPGGMVGMTTVAVGCPSTG
jgi:hypothetical protein